MKITKKTKNRMNKRLSKACESGHIPMILDALCANASDAGMKVDANGKVTWSKDFWPTKE